MAKYLAAALLGAAAAGLVACGGGETSERRDPVIPVVADRRAPATYTLADPSCQQASAPVALTHASVRAWNGDQIETHRVTLDGVSSKASLGSAAVSETTYDDVYERACDVDKGEGHYCDDKSGAEQGWVNAHALTPLRICRDDFDYGRTSYEGVALASIHYIQTAQSRYKQLAPGNTDLPTIKLSVLPEFIDYYDNFPQRDGTKVRLKTWITHNSAHFQSPPMIAVFPEAAEDARSAKGFFWESQFVLAHEYGHHIDFTRNGMLLSQMGLRWIPFEHRFFDEYAFDIGGAGTSDRAQVHGAVGETFADMTAFYAEGGTGASLRGLPCFGINRDIANANFLNGDKKALTEDRFDLVLGKTQEDDKPCGQPQYRDIHIIGAIVGHALDQAFARLTASTATLVPGSADDIDQRYRLTIAWMDKYVKASRALALDQKGSAWLEPIATALEGVADDFLGTFALRDDGHETAGVVRKDLCKILKEGFPVMPAPPFALTGGACG